MRPAVRVGAALLLGIPVLLVLLASAGVLVAQGGTGLPQPPELTLVLQPVARVARDLAAALCLSALVVGGLLPPARSLRALWWAAVSALGWLAAVALQGVFTVSEVLAVPVGDALAPGTLWPFLTDVTAGRVLLAEAGLAVVVALGSVVLATRPAQADLRRTGVWVLALVAVAGVMAPALAGHGGLSGTHLVTAASLAVHIAAVSLWIGGLVVVVALLRYEPELTGTLLPRFSALALGCVLLVGESGLLNASQRLGSPVLLLGSWYGALVLAKAVLLAWLVRLGWRQRRRTIASLGPDAQATAALLARYAGWEFLAMGLALGVSVALVRIGPQPVLPGEPTLFPLTVVLLVLAVPLVAGWSWLDREPPAALARLRAYPEVAAVVMLAAVAEVAAVGALDTVLGPGLGALLDVGILVGVGLVFIAAVTGPNGVVGIVLAMILWPLVTWFAASRADGPLGSASSGGVVGASVLLAEALLGVLLVLVLGRRPSADEVATTTSSATGRVAAP